MKKLLFMIHGLNRAGAQKVLVDMINNLDFNHYDITIHTLYNWNEFLANIDKRVHIKSIIKAKNKLMFRIKAFLLRRCVSLKWIYNRYVKDDYDYEIAYLEGEVTRLLSYSTNEKAKKYAWVHTNFMELFSSQGLYKTLSQHREVYKKYDKVVCVSESVKKGFIERFGGVVWDNVVTLYNVIDEKAISAKAQETITDFNEVEYLRLITVSKLRPEKRHILLLNVLKRLKEEGYNFFLHIVGDGPEYISIKKHIEFQHLSDCVKMLGQKSNPYPYIQKSDLLIIASSVEGYPTVAIEAGILFVPVISTDCGGINEIDNIDCNMVVENSEEGLYKGLKRIFENVEVLQQYRKSLVENCSFFMSERMAEIEKLFQE